MASVGSARVEYLLGFRRRAPLPRLPFPAPPAANRLGGVRMAASGESTPPSTTIEVLGAAGPVLAVAAPGLPEADFRNAVDSALFKQWLRNLRTEKGVLTYGMLNLTRILIQVLVHLILRCRVLCWGSTCSGNMWDFSSLKLKLWTRKPKPRFQGLSLQEDLLLILLESKGKTYAVLTEQVRVPVGKFNLELPAGMLDDEKGDFVGTAVPEVEEETGWL